jgi:hypothetical protein
VTIASALSPGPCRGKNARRTLGFGRRCPAGCIGGFLDHDEAAIHGPREVVRWRHIDRTRQAKKHNGGGRGRNRASNLRNGRSRSRACSGCRYVLRRQSVVPPVGRRRAHARGGPQVHFLMVQRGCSVAHRITSRDAGLAMQATATGCRNGTWNSSQCVGSSIRHARTTSSTTFAILCHIAALPRLRDHGAA